MPIFDLSPTSSRHLYLYSPPFDLRTVELRDNGIGVLGSDVDKQVAFPDVHITDSGTGQTRVALDGGNDVLLANTHLSAGVEVQTDMSLRRPLARARLFGRHGTVFGRMLNRLGLNG